MDDWHATSLGRRHLPTDLTAFEIEAFFSFSASERRVIEQRRNPALRLGLALQIGFLRMSGRLLEAIGVIPPELWRHLGDQFDIRAPDLASLRAMYRRPRTLFEHQELACTTLGFHPMNEAQRRVLVRVLRRELDRTADRQRLLVFVRRWAYEHRFIVARERDLRSLVAAATRRHEATLTRMIHESVGLPQLTDWHAALGRPHGSSGTIQAWLWAAPARHSTAQIDDALARHNMLCDLGVDRALSNVSDVLLRRYARRLAKRPPSIGARIQEPARTIEVACFLRYCLLATTDQLLLMVRRRVAELWRMARADSGSASTDWEALYQELLQQLVALVEDPAFTGDMARARLAALVEAQRGRRPRSRAEIARSRLIDGVRPVRSLLRALVQLPWHSTPDHAVTEAMRTLRSLYVEKNLCLPVGTAVRISRVWRSAIEGADRERAFRALEVATLLDLRRALQNGTVWIEHSFAFRSRERLLLPKERWVHERRRHYRRLSLPQDPAEYMGPLVERAESWMAAVAQAAAEGALRVDDDVHLTPLAEEEEDPRVAELRTALDRRIGEAQLPELILAVDAEVRFSWIMLGREPRSSQELLMVYAGILAHGTALSAAETARMIPQLSAGSVRQAMRWASDERRLAEACHAVLAFMHRHPIVATWGRADLASADMMSLETSKRVWQARVDPRRRTASVGIYAHVRDRWGIFYAQPIVLNERQAGAAIEGVVRDEQLETSQLGVDTHGYTDFAMALAKLLGFDLCPRLKALKERRLFLPIGTRIPPIIQSICHANVDPSRVADHWEGLAHLTASVHCGHASAVSVLSRFGSAARGDPLYEAGVHLGRLLRTVFLADYFVIPAFRRELLRVMNRGESVNSLKRAIHAGRVATHQARRTEEMQAVADALSLLANIVMAWNTAQMQSSLHQWTLGRGSAVPPELIGRIAPTRTEGINMRGVFRFPIERYASQLLPSSGTARAGAGRR